MMLFAVASKTSVFGPKSRRNWPRSVKRLLSSVKISNDYTERTYRSTFPLITLLLFRLRLVQGARPRGRPKKTWREIVEKTVRHVN